MVSYLKEGMRIKSCDPLSGRVLGFAPLEHKPWKNKWTSPKLTTSACQEQAQGEGMNRQATDWGGHFQITYMIKEN